ncbi:hypothetical protein RUM43_011700 [Polyplax serrata]|uniref:Uncharacterized protein n=1 Tax=Polyplax serrata TaxID=468196 RepID=A0AAN8S3T9_POLSC
MTSICFVCNLPILSHQVGLVWQGGNGWDDLVREQMEESTLRQRLGTGRRDSAAQITSISPPTEAQETSPPHSAAVRRRRSSLAQLTDILREWGGSTTRASLRGSKQAQLCRRETLADLAKSLPWGKSSTSTTTATTDLSSSSSFIKKRRESSADSGIKSTSSKRRESSTTAISDFRSDIARLWGSRRESTIGNGNARSDLSRRGSGESGKSRRNSNANSRRSSGESGRSRRDSMSSTSVVAPSVHQKQHSCRHHRRKASRAELDEKYYRNEQRPSTSSTASDSVPVSTTETNTQVLPPPTIVTSSVTPPSTSPKAISPVRPSVSSSPFDKQLNSAATSPVRTSPVSLASTRRDSTTQVYYKSRRDSRSPDGRPRDPKKFPRLPRQSTAIDEALPPSTSRRESQPTLSPDPSGEDVIGRKARRDSLSPDSAGCGRSGRESRSRLSPDRSTDKDVSPSGRTRRGTQLPKLLSTATVADN